jgi:YD repeat-containing protein
VTDPLNRVTRLTFDYMGNVTELAKFAGTPDVVTTTATYHPIFGEIASYTDALSHSTQLAYDSAGNLVGVTNPLGHTLSGTYDSEGKLAEGFEVEKVSGGRQSTAALRVPDRNPGGQSSFVCCPPGCPG